MKHRTVIAFTIIVMGVYWWSSFGEVPVESQLERLYSLTPIYLCVVFGIHWYRSRELEERIEKLERAAAERENALNPPG